MDKKRLKELTKLVNSKWIWDREEAAKAADLPLELQEILARDENCNIRWSLAWNPSVTDWKIWELLRNDEDYMVRNIINYRIKEEKDKIKAEFKRKLFDLDN